MSNAVCQTETVLDSFRSHLIHVYVFCYRSHRLHFIRGRKVAIGHNVIAIYPKVFVSFAVGITLYSPHPCP